MGATCSSENQQSLLDIYQNESSDNVEKTNWDFKIASFIDTHCELGEDYFMPFMEYVSAFYIYNMELFKNKAIGYINQMAQVVLRTHKPEIQISGFGFGNKTHMNNKDGFEYTYIVGMRLKTFPLNSTKSEP
jgi:hypothetical protein